ACQASAFPGIARPASSPARARAHSTAAAVLYFSVRVTAPPSKKKSPAGCESGRARESGNVRKVSGGEVYRLLPSACRWRRRRPFSAGSQPFPFSDKPVLGDALGRDTGEDFVPEQPLVGVGVRGRRPPVPDSRNHGVPASALLLAAQLFDTSANTSHVSRERRSPPVRWNNLPRTS